MAIGLTSSFERRTVVGTMAAAKARAKAHGEKNEPGRARAPNRRGSPEAIEKRRAARVFNDVLGGRGTASQKLDGRTEKLSAPRFQAYMRVHHSTPATTAQIDVVRRGERLGVEVRFFE